MLPSHFIRLCITSATLIAASPLATVASQPTSLPSALQQGVPLCAQSCLQSSLAERFPVACNGQDGIQCLCSRYSNSGESLGEVALGCVYSSCSTVDRGAATAYNVCLGQKDAVMPTKTALTVVASSAPRTTSTSSSSSSKSTATPSVTTTLLSQVASTHTVFADSIASVPSATSSPSPSFTAVPATTNASPKMTPAQIAGLSVAAVAAFAIAVGLMALSVCLRRRKERKNTFDSDEKGTGRKSKKYSTQVSHYVAMGSDPLPSKQFPKAPPPAVRKGGMNPGLTLTTPKGHPVALYPSRPVQRNGVGTSNNSSNSSISLSQIGVAISAELDGKSIGAQSSSKAIAKVQQPQNNVPFRPFSTMTQDTVFEEDEMAARRRSSALLPTPPFPIAPIRSLQPSRPAAASGNATVLPSPPKYSRQTTRRSELFLNIPILQERPQPRRIITAEMPSTGSPKQLPLSQVNRLAPPVRRTSSTSPQKTPASSREPSNAGDIDDYYFSSHDESPPRAKPVRPAYARDSPKAAQIKFKRSRSTVSRTSSRASTNIRDSLSSQTSFETADPSDPTPEDEDSDKQLSDDKLSPVAESPISNLRYPKVPRASNQLVPRSPKTSQPYNSMRSPRNQSTPRRNAPSPNPRPTPSPSLMLQTRRKDLAPLLLESRVPLRMHAPTDVAPAPAPALRLVLKDPFTSPPRTHGRSNSAESWSTTPRSKLDRKSRTQSGMWPSSPAMYDEELSPAPVKPLNVKRKEETLSVRRKRDEMKEINVGRDVDIDEGGLKSPIWVPRLTPTRKGDDLFISVGWGAQGRP